MARSKDRTPAGDHWTEFEREERYAEVARLYKACLSLRDIADAVGVSKSQAHKDLAEVRRRWRESSIRDFDAAKERELEAIDRVEMAAWEGWERSLEDAVKLVEEDKQAGEYPGKTNRMETQGQSGDARFLNTVMSCIERRCKIFGVDAPTELNVRDTGPPKVVEVLVTNRQEADQLPTLTEVLASGRFSGN